MLVDEDEFQAKVMKDHIYRRHISSHSRITWYAKLTHIGRRQTVSEIDLVVVEGRERAFAYEFKFLRGKDANYNYRRHACICQDVGMQCIVFQRIGRRPNNTLPL